jgi:hypothetical protein
MQHTWRLVRIRSLSKPTNRELGAALCSALRRQRRLTSLVRSEQQWNSWKDAFTAESTVY